MTDKLPKREAKTESYASHQAETPNHKRHIPTKHKATTEIRGTLQSCYSRVCRNLSILSEGQIYLKIWRDTRKDLTNIRYSEIELVKELMGEKTSLLSSENTKKASNVMKSDRDTNRRLKKSHNPDLKQKVKSQGFARRDRFLHNVTTDSNDCAATDDKGFIQVASSQSLAIYNRHDISTFAELIHHYFGLIEQSDSASRTLDQISERGWTFQFDDLGNGGYYIDGETKTVWLDHAGLEAQALARSDYFYASSMMNILRSLRDAWQEGRWDNAIRTYHPESLLMLEKMRAADSDVIAVLFAKELQMSGCDVFMRHLLASDDAFLGRYFLNDDHLVKVQAASSFRSWFLETSRVDTTDHETLCYLDGVLENAGHGNPFGRNRLTPIEVVRMGCLPDGTSYLAGYGEAVLRDPIFAGLSDEINQAHYFHLIRDMEAYFVNGVPFRSPRLASKIFPEEHAVTQD